MMQACVGVAAEIHVECVEVFKVVVEECFDLPACFVEVDDDVAFVFVFGKLFCKVAFPDTACTVEEDGAFSILFLFPVKEFVIYFSFHWFIVYCCCLFHVSLIIV